MAAYEKVQPFVEHLAEGVHNLETGTLTVALYAAANAPSLASTGLPASQISYTNLSSRTLTVSSSSQTTGTYSLVLADKVLTASGGTVGPFRYAWIYNDTPTSPADPGICRYDYGSDITLADGETFTLDFGANLFTLV